MTGRRRHREIVGRHDEGGMGVTARTRLARGNGFVQSPIQGIHRNVLFEEKGDSLPPYFLIILYFTTNADPPNPKQRIHGDESPATRRSDRAPAHPAQGGMIRDNRVPIPPRPVKTVTGTDPSGSYTAGPDNRRNSARKVSGRGDATVRFRPSAM
jgi:hypothetical protein